LDSKEEDLLAKFQKEKEALRKKEILEQKRIEN
jgi:hypothetical protein